MNLVLAEVLRSNNGIRSSITTLPSGFKIGVQIDEEGLFHLSFYTQEDILIMSTLIDVDNRLKEVLCKIDVNNRTKIETNMLGIINYDLLYFIVNGSYEDDDLNEEPNRAIFDENIRALNLNYIKNAWLCDLQCECLYKVQIVAREHTQTSQKPSNKSRHPNKK